MAKARLSLAASVDLDTVEADIDAALRDHYSYGELWNVLGDVRYKRNHGMCEESGRDGRARGADKGREVGRMEAEAVFQCSSPLTIVPFPNFILPSHASRSAHCLRARDRLARRVAGHGHCAAPPRRHLSCQRRL